MTNILILIGGIIGIFLVLRLILWFRSWSKKGKPAPKVGGKLGTLIDKGENVIAYFYSPACGACNIQEKILNKVQKNFSNIIRINVTRETSVAKNFGIMGTPTTVLIKNSKIQEYFVGVTSESKILNSLGHI